MNARVDGEGRRARERADVAIVLLLLQSAFGLLGLLAMVALASIFPIVSPVGLLYVAGFLVPLIGAIGAARGWHWARRVAMAYQVLTLLGLAINLLLDYLPPVQVELTLSGLLTGALLPVALIVLLRGPLPERAAERLRTPPVSTVPAAPAGMRQRARQGVA